MTKCYQSRLVQLNPKCAYLLPKKDFNIKTYSSSMISQMVTNDEEKTHGILIKGSDLFVVAHPYVLTIGQKRYAEIPLSIWQSCAVYDITRCITGFTDSSNPNHEDIYQNLRNHVETYVKNIEIVKYNAHNDCTTHIYEIPGHLCLKPGESVKLFWISDILMNDQYFGIREF